jgi:hypothetical protein
VNLGRGFKPDATGRALAAGMVPHHQLPGLGVPRPKASLPATQNYTLLPAIGGVGNQGSLGSCVAFTIWRDLLGLSLAGQGTPMILSPMAGYTRSLRMTQKINGVPDTTTITDDGLEPSIAVMALYAEGPSLESEWPYDVSTFGQAESFVQAADSAPRIPLVNGVYAGIAETGQALVTAVAQALQPLPDGRLGRGVAFDIDADDPAFQNATGADVLGAPTTNNPTNHEISVIDVAPAADGSLIFLCLNHWATTWSPLCHVPGCVWVSEQFVMAYGARGSSFRLINAELAKAPS